MEKKQPSRNKINILMTGAGAPGAAGIIHCLKQYSRLEIFVADANEEATGRHLVSRFFKIPPGNSPDFADKLLTICLENNIEIVMPLVTAELPALAENKERFKNEGITLMISSPGSLEIAINKSRLCQFLEWRGLPVPVFHVVETADQFRDAVEALGYPDQPVCFKPSLSNGSRGFRVINENVNESELLFRYKPNNVYMSLRDALRILSSSPFPELLVSEFLPGDEYSVDCLACEGESILIVPRFRKKMLEGISTAGEFIKNEKIIQYCRDIIRELKLDGNIGIQVKGSVHNEYLILEINPRVQGTISAGLGAGVNLPVLAVKQALGENLPAGELQVRWGTKFSRYWQEVFY